MIPNINYKIRSVLGKIKHGVCFASGGSFDKTAFDSYGGCYLSYEDLHSPNTWLRDFRIDCEGVKVNFDKEPFARIYKGNRRVVS